MDNKERLIELINDDLGMPRAADRLAEKIAAANLLAPEWISVKERLPEKGQLILVTGHEYDDPSKPRFQLVSRYDGNEFEQWTPSQSNEDGGYWQGECYVTHWQPLPAAPKDNHDD